MYAPEFPEEIRRMMLKKLPPADLLRAYSTHEQFAQFRHDKVFEKSLENLTLEQLCQLHNESETTKQKELCFHEQVIEKLRINSFNEVVRLYMRPENNDFFSNNKILESLHGKIILVEETEIQESTLARSEFSRVCIELFEKMEGDLFLAFMDFRVEFGSDNQKFDFRSRVKYVIYSQKCDIHSQVGAFMYEFPNMEVAYFNHECSINHGCHNILLNTNNNWKDNLKKLISFMNTKVLQSAIPSLEALLPMVQKRLTFTENEGIVKCDHCPLISVLTNSILLMRAKPLGNKAPITKCDHCMI